MTTIFRRLGNLGDKAMLLEWANSPEVVKYMYRDHVIAPAEHDAWYGKAIADPHKLVIEHSGVAIGFAQASCISERDHRWTWGDYIAAPHMRGKGIGKEIDRLMAGHIFDFWGGRKIQIEMFAWNKRAIQRHLKCGYRHEGYYREHIEKNGERHDIVALALLAHEWEVMKHKREMENGNCTHENTQDKADIPESRRIVA